jgi:hypothetical protein
MDKAARQLLGVFALRRPCQAANPVIGPGLRQRLPRTIRSRV